MLQLALHRPGLKYLCHDAVHISGDHMQSE